MAGAHERLDTDLLRASGGRLFAKIGAEAIYAIGVCGGERALAVKLDDGGKRGLHAVVLALCERLGWLDSEESRALAQWSERRLFNRAGLEVGSLEVLPA